MIVLTPNPQYRFVARDGSPSDEAVIRETWSENVYRIFASDLGRPDATMIDLGANIGAVSIYAASLNTQARIIAVEPEPDNLKHLWQNIEANGVGVQVLEAAISSSPGSGWIVPRHGNSILTFAPQPEATQVAVLALADLFDEYAIDECDVLKIDVEGAEYDIIAGADMDTLARIRYLTLEFDAAPDDVFGPMVAKLAKLFGIQILGSPERGGYIYARRY